MGSAPTKSETKSQASPKTILVRDRSSTFTNDPDDEETIEDKIKLQPVRDYSEEPNPVMTDDVQRKLNMKSVVKRVLLKNAMREQFILARAKRGNEDLETIDVHASRAPKEVLDSFEHLIDYLEAPLQNRIDRTRMLVRSFVVWIGSNAGETTTDNVVVEETSGKSPTYLLGLLKANFTTCLTIFTLLCWSAGIKCRKISGVGRSTGSKEGELSQSSWAAVLINNAWQLVHPNRACKAVAGKIPPGLTKSYPFENRQNRDKEILATYLNFYILSNPEHFIYEYFPDDEKWQLLPEPISKEQFMAQERVFHPLWSMGIRMFHEPGHVLTSNSGRATLSFVSTDGLETELVMWYEIRLVTSGEHLNSTQFESLQKLVYMIRSNSLWTFEILLPYTGKYIIDIYAGRLRGPLYRSSEFEIDCTVCHPDPIPLPINPGVIGLGPGPVMLSGGLSKPSVVSGIVQADMEKDFILKFKVKTDCSVKATLVISETRDDFKSDESLKEETEVPIKQPNCHFKKKQTYVELHVNVFPPKIPGQYLLEISTSTGANDSDMTAVCYYLLIYDLIYEHEKETCKLRVARRMLRVSAEGNDINEILFRIQDCVCKKIPENDVDVQVARGRVLVLNNIQARTQRGRKFSIDTRLQATNIVRQVKYEACVNELIKVLSKLVLCMRDQGKQSPEVTTSCSQLSVDTTNRDGVEEVLNIMLCLLGKNEYEEKSLVVQTEEVLSNVKRHGLVVHQKCIEKTEKLIKAHTGVFDSKTIKMALKSVRDIIVLMTVDASADSHT